MFLHIVQCIVLQLNGKYKTLKPSRKRDSLEHDSVKTDMIEYLMWILSYRKQSEYQEIFSV